MRRMMPRLTVWQRRSTKRGRALWRLGLGCLAGTLRCGKCCGDPFVSCFLGFANINKPSHRRPVPARGKGQPRGRVARSSQTEAREGRPELNANETRGHGRGLQAPQTTPLKHMVTVDSIGASTHWANELAMHSCTDGTEGSRRRRLWSNLRSLSISSRVLWSSKMTR